MQVSLEQKPKTYVVVNPVAGVSQLEVVRERIQSALQARQIPSKVYETTGREDLRQHVRDAVKQGYRLFISAGGDGTLSSVIDGLVGTDIPLVIIPTGTWNALARALDIPLQVEQAVDLLLGEHNVRTLDVMEVNNRFFVLSISAGIGALAMKDVKREEKRRMGKFADLRKAVSEMLAFRAFQFEVKIGGQVTKFRASELMVANAAIVGIKLLQLDPNIRMDDGKLNVCRIYAKTLVEYLKLGASMLRGDQKHNWNILCVETSDEIEINSRQRLPVQGDGELIGYLPVTVRIRPKAIRVVTPVNTDIS